LVDLTDRGRALEAEIRGVTDQIEEACQRPGYDMDALRRTLDSLARD
jgi:hypothetical protein